MVLIWLSWKLNPESSLNFGETKFQVINNMRSIELCALLKILFSIAYNIMQELILKITEKYFDIKCFKKANYVSLLSDEPIGLGHGGIKIK